MRTSVIKTLVAATVVAVFLGVGIYAYAHMGGGYGMMGGGYGGYGMMGGGYGMMGGPMMDQGWYGGRGYGPGANLSEEDFRALEKERQAYFEATEDLRRDIYAKELKLQSELAKDEPDTVRASALQEEISGLAAKLDQKRIDHLVRVRKINPDAGRNFAGMGPMMGYGGQSGCW